MALHRPQRQAADARVRPRGQRHQRLPLRLGSPAVRSGDDLSLHCQLRLTGDGAIKYVYDAASNRLQRALATTFYGYNGANELCWSGATNGTQYNGTSCPSTPAGDGSYTYSGNGNQLTGSNPPATYT